MLAPGLDIIIIRMGRVALLALDPVFGDFKGALSGLRGCSLSREPLLFLSSFPGRARFALLE